MFARHITVEKTLIAAYALSTMGILMLGVLFYVATRQEIAASDWVAHTERSIGDIEAIHRLALDAESTGRAYLISGRSDMLARYEQQVPALYKSVVTFKLATADNPNQQRLAGELTARLNTRFTAFGKRLQLRSEGGWSALEAMRYDTSGLEDMRRITATLRAMASEEAGLLQMRQDMREENIHTLWYSIAALIVLGLGMLSLLWQRMLFEVKLRRKAELHLQQQAYHDVLTNLPNGRKLHEYVGHALAAARRHGHRMAVLSLDLDGFKRVNDTMGHGVGDALLKEVAQRLEALVRRDDIAARLGGDEFTIALQRVTAPEEAHRLAARLIDCLSKPYAATNGELSVTASIGIALYPDHGQDWDTLSKNADGALYAAKRDGKNTYAVAQARLALAA
jgi:diguanylate cyclase (GGDEF)-like protein